jgi:hypothetical protein
MSRDMAPPSARMRLTVEVLPLAAENAHGPYSSHALAVFKGRKFALPVGMEDTFEAVWSQIEHRYKTSYLDAQQAANFTIKKLQDAYDCDLFMTDTVGSIFEGETDAAMRMIKVVPTFLNRDFSVPATTSLRPAHAQKRSRELEGHESSKRRRTDQSTGSLNLDDLDRARDQPVHSTEHSRRGSRSRSRSHRAQSGSKACSRASRSVTEASVVFVNRVRTGQGEFAPTVKEESPELGSPPPSCPPAQLKPNLSRNNGASRHTSSRTPIGSAQVVADSRPASQAADGVVEDMADDAFDATADADDEAAQTPERATQDSALRRSLEPTSAQRQRTPPRAPTQRRNIYDMPSSPEFLSNEKIKAKTTYASQVRTPAKAVSSPSSRPGSLRKLARKVLLDGKNSNEARQLKAASSSCETADKASSILRNEAGRPRKGVTPVGCTPAGALANKKTHESGHPPKNIVANTSPKLGTAETATTSQPIKVTSPAESFIQQVNASKKVDMHARESSCEEEDDESTVVVGPLNTACHDQYSGGRPPSQSSQPLPKSNVVTVAAGINAGQDKMTSSDRRKSACVEQASVVNGKMPKIKNMTDTSTPWNAQSWGFGALNQSNGTVEKDAVEIQAEETTGPSIQGAPKEVRDAVVDAQTALPSEVHSLSRSGSPAASTRSSPVLLRQPARFLSRSPSSESLASDRSSQAPSVALSKSASPAVVAERAGRDSDPSSQSDESSTEDENEVENAVPSTAPYQITSSPPNFDIAPASTPSLPATSQPIFSQQVRQTPIPLPANVSRIREGRPTAQRHASFPTLREQLVVAKTPRNHSQKKAYDPRLATLARLSAKAKPAADSGLADDESSDEDSSSSDDSE